MVQQEKATVRGLRDKLADAGNELACARVGMEQARNDATKRTEETAAFRVAHEALCAQEKAARDAHAALLARTGKLDAALEEARAECVSGVRASAGQRQLAASEGGDVTASLIGQARRRRAATMVDERRVGALCLAGELKECEVAGAARDAYFMGEVKRLGKKLQVQKRASHGDQDAAATYDLDVNVLLQRYAAAAKEAQTWKEAYDTLAGALGDTLKKSLAS